MDVRRLRLGGGILAALALALAGSAQAQDIDPTARYDIDDLLHRHAHDIDELPSEEAARGRPVTLNLTLGGTYSTNAAATRFDTFDTGYVTPGVAMGVTPVNLAGWDVGGGAKLDADYYTDRYDDGLGEGRFEAFVFAERSLGPGTLTAEVIPFWVFDNGFSDEQFWLLISNLNYNLSRGGLSADFAVEYEQSDIPELRRTRLMTTLAYTLPEPQLGYEWTIEGDVAFADFNGGANQNRNDTTAALVLIASRRLAPGWSLEWEAAFVQRFSNRERSRFTALDLGVELGWRF